MVEIELPKGFALDNADAPRPFTAANIGKYEVKLGLTKMTARLFTGATFLWRQ
jgi:hypothetical protein